MSVEIKLNSVPAGYSFFQPQKTGKQNVAVDGFFSTEDHDQLLSLLEGFPDQIVQSLPFDMRTIPSNIDHLIVVIDKESVASVYVNEVLFITDVEVKSGVKKAAFVRDEDILYVRSMFPDGVDIPEDAGLLVLFSVGWRKGLFYDFRPVHPESNGKRPYDLPVRLGKIYSYLLFQNKNHISAVHYRRMMEQQWFPFFSLDQPIIDEMLERTSRLKALDGMIPAIEEFVSANIEIVGNKVRMSDVLLEQRELEHEALSAYQEGDWKRSIRASVGWMTHVMHQCQIPAGGSRESTDARVVDAGGSIHNPNYSAYSALLPLPFEQFLTGAFLPSFSSSDVDASDSSRAAAKLSKEHFLRKGALLGILCLDQMALFLAGQKQPLEPAAPRDSSTERFNEEGSP